MQNFNQLNYNDVCAEEPLPHLWLYQAALVASTLHDSGMASRSVREAFSDGPSAEWAKRAMVDHGGVDAIFAIPSSPKNDISADDRADLIADLAEATLRTFNSRKFLDFIDNQWRQVMTIVDRFEYHRLQRGGVAWEGRACRRRGG
ncbi:hypothetical protein TI39_contig4377g00001 [Zymoseptoria brevis]|uniref:Uncharacterized protein n=1 Tax=Zymoseptoria brevis TaxID=1047168 RepID=A0A0F4G720_9PEZI|nr:hypothetical protein TI39_contig4377g00001 [Zymoseptoria brevis]